jgi:transposase
MQVRHQVVDAIVEAFTTDDPSALPTAATAEERDAADMEIDRLLGRQPGQAQRRRVVQLLFHAYRSGDDWNDLFDRLTPFEVAELRELFPHMPSRAARHFTDRFLFPAG